MSSHEEGFLARWSRRKREAQATPAEAPAPPPPGAEPAAADTPDPPGPPAFDPASLPPVESLTPESDIAAFLRAEVPAVLRHAALRRIWSLDPAIRDYVGPADYAWDFNAPDAMPGFAPTLGGDVKRLLAQAIGLEEADGTAAPEARTQSDPQPEPAEPGRRSPDPPGEPAAVAEDPPLPPPAPQAPEPPVPEPPVAVRRHGRALPS